MREIEDQIRLWVDGAVDGVEAVSADEVRSGAAASPDDRVMRRPRRWLAPGIAAAMVVVVAAAAIAVSTGSDPQPTHVKTLDPAAQSAVAPTSPEPLWRELREPTFGWTLEIPPAWRSQSFRDRCRVGESGTIITNLPGPISFDEISNGCTTALALPDSPPDDLIVLEVSHYTGGPYPPAVPPPDTPLPLRIPSPPGHPEGQLVHRSLGIVADGDWRFHLSLWTGRGVSEADERLIVRTVESIHPSKQPPLEPITFLGLPAGSKQVQLTSDGETTGSLGQAVTTALYRLGPRQSGGRDSSIRATIWRSIGARESFDELRRTGELQSLEVAVPVRPTAVRGGVEALRGETTWNGDQITSVQWLERDDVKVEVVGYNVEDDVFDELVDRLIVVA